MKIAYHDNSLGFRGTTIALYDNAYYLREILGIEPLILHHNRWIDRTDPSVIKKFEENGMKVIGYDSINDIDSILEENNVDKFYVIKRGGENDVDSEVMSKTRENFLNSNSMCTMSDINHFTTNYNCKFAFASKWLSDDNGNDIPVMPHMINLPNTDEDLKSELNIPKESIVFGRYGGHETFDIPFVKDCIRDVLNKRDDIYFLFQHTDKFIDHERVIFLPASTNLESKVKMINTCDFMLHARVVGESFGLAVGEFSTRNKRIITYFGSKERSHIDILGDGGIYYNNYDELMDIIINSSKEEGDFNYYKDYTPEKVVNKFKEIYL
jgi:hypothetical protein